MAKTLYGGKSVDNSNLSPWKVDNDQDKCAGGWVTFDAKLDSSSYVLITTASDYYKATNTLDAGAICGVQLLG